MEKDVADLADHRRLRRQADVQRSSMQRLNFSRVRVPAEIFARLGKLTAVEATWECPTCGVIEPISVAQGFLRRECECQRLWRYQENALRDQKQQRADSREKMTSEDDCYTWLNPWSTEGLGERTFANFEIHTDDRLYAYQRAIHFADEPAGMLLLHGGWGSGKTHLAAAICNQLRLRGVPCLFATGPNLFNALRDRRDGGESDLDILKRMYHTPLLVIDDIDKARLTKTGYREEIYFEVFDQRTNRGLPMVLTTNRSIRQDARELAEYIGGAAASRLNIGLVILALGGDDYRVTMVGA